ncbi:transcriptional regulator [Clostridium aceticum]|uniref:Transcriptional regulator n=1 Tax=Clostridium aceticum TaxID=84022 RepID=A0A0G3WDU0_9CLOT|nr:MarR family transcriptional regulator [Clostridium aceticum]AKL96518.1 transcriptional regulator [Clostridium aceticum]
MCNTISNNLYNALQRLNRQMHRHKHRMMPPREGLHRGQIHLLFHISKNDGVIQRDLAELMDMRPSSLTEMLTHLEQNSLIERRQNEKDRRVIHVYLTDAGKTAVSGFVQDNDNLAASLFNCLTTEEMEKMLEIVTKINTNLEGMDSGDIKERCGGRRHHHGHREHKKCHRFSKYISLEF